MKRATKCNLALARYLSRNFRRPVICPVCHGRGRVSASRNYGLSIDVRVLHRKYGKRPQKKCFVGTVRLQFLQNFPVMEAVGWSVKDLITTLQLTLKMKTILYIPKKDHQLYLEILAFQDRKQPTPNALVEREVQQFYDN